MRQFLALAFIDVSLAACAADNTYSGRSTLSLPLAGECPRYHAQQAQIIFATPSQPSERPPERQCPPAVHIALPECGWRDAACRGCC